MGRARRGRRVPFLVALLLVAAAGVVVRGLLADPARAPEASRDSADVVTRPPRAPLRVDVGAGEGRAVPSGFLGFSFEFQAVRQYTGSDPRHVDPVLVQLIRNLTPGQAPVLRIGGDSTDVSYVPAPGVKPPPYVDYALTPGWLATTAALAHKLRARMIMGLNLAANQPRLAAAEARRFLGAIGRGSISALEIGNEPNVYGKITVYHTVLGVPVSARPAAFGYPQFRRQLRAVAAAVPRLGLAGPALAIGPTPGPGSWVRTIPSFLREDPRFQTMTVHRYPLRNCYVPPSSPQYPTIAHLLAPYATTTLADSLKRWVAIAHGQGRSIRVDELNSVACRGKTGVSDTFASALWATDALFSLVRAGVDGIDMHTLPNAAYQLFSFSHPGGRWEAAVRPVYYGLQLFAQAAPAGSRLLSVARAGDGGGVSSWATRAPDGTVRVVLINKNRRGSREVSLGAAPGGAGAPDATGATGASGASGASATVERMQAPSVRSQGGVSLGGRSYGAQTGTGRLGAPRLSTVASVNGRFALAVPHGSAALVTLPPS